jgi:two-component system sensor histidine kinase BaeS
MSFSFKKIIQLLGTSIAIALLVLAVYYSNNAIAKVVRNFPSWIVPLVLSVIIVAVCGVILSRIRKTDLLKYDFITVVTQKFTMPLQTIRHSIQTYRTTEDPIERDTSVSEIKKSGIQLVELTDILVGLAKIEGSEYSYRSEKLSATDLVRDIVLAYEAKIAEKKIHVSVTVPHTAPELLVDINRMHFALEMLMENAVTFTPIGGNIYVTLTTDSPVIHIVIRDTGPGIKREELGYVFSKFYKGGGATQGHGMGIGLYMAKNIIEKHRGKIRVDSEGLGHGAFFTVTLPIAP